jgi:hypothetical protein
MLALLKSPSANYKITSLDERGMNDSGTQISSIDR